MGGILGGFTTEEFSFQRFNQGKIGQVATASGKSIAGTDESVGDTHQQIGGYKSLLARADQFAAGTEGKRSVQGHTHHREGGLPLPHGCFVHLRLITRQRRDPVFGDAVTRSGRLAPPSSQHAPSPSSGGLYHRFRREAFS
jgi:hypothetical protein